MDGSGTSLFAVIVLRPIYVAAPVGLSLEPLTVVAWLGHERAASWPCSPPIGLRTLELHTLERAVRAGKSMFTVFFGSVILLSPVSRPSRLSGVGSCGGSRLLMSRRPPGGREEEPALYDAVDATLSVLRADPA